MFGEGQTEMFGGPRFMIRVASLDMHPLDTVDRLGMLRDQLNIGLCNITKCCSEVCPEHIHITDNAIIPLKERVVDEYYDPVLWLFRKVFGRGKRKSLPVVSAPAN
jgi:succinate dehydrogenase / fumarate reductase iron-sulfur subunit